MFDEVGRGRKVRRQREAGSILLSVVLNGGLLAGILAVGMHQRAAETPRPQDAVEVRYFEAAPVPAAPPPPPPRRSAQKKEGPSVPRPTEVEKEVQTLPETLPETPPPEDLGGGGSPEGREGGVDGGTGTGFVLSTAPAAPAVRSYHWSEVKVKRRVEPVYPEGAKKLDLGEQSCTVNVYIDERGDPYDVGVEKCPALFQESARTAVMQWRFYPMKVNGQAQKAQFVLRIKYQLR